jgi:photosystem II stability/assembly factor-like uncharacterized protein
MPRPSLGFLCAVLSFFLLAASAPAASSGIWRSIGPDGGSVAALSFAPSDAKIAYAGGAEGGIFRSGDGGASWTSVSNGLGTLVVKCLAVDPRDPATVYVGTLSGLYQTTSGGASWRPLPVRPGGFFSAVTAIRTDPVQPHALVAATDTGLFRSTDGGDHWTKCDAGLPRAVAALDLDPDHPGTLYAALANGASTASSPLLYKTTDGGGHWSPLPGLKASAVTALARQRPAGTLYAATPEGLFATTDGGATFTSLSAGPLNALAAAASGTLFGATASGQVVKSGDGGKTWSEPASTSRVSPAGVTVLALDASGVHLLAGTSAQGLFALDAAAGWKEARRGYRASRVSGLAITAASPPLLFASTLGGGVFASSGGGDFSPRNSGIPAHPWGVLATVLAADPTVPGTLAVGVDLGQVAETADAGLKWAARSPTCLSVDHLALAAPATLFVSSALAFNSGGCSGATCTAKVSRDGGASFACLEGPQEVTAFLVDPARAGTVYAAGGDAFWKSTDRGAHFARVANHLGMVVTALAASPAAPQTLYAGGYKGLLKSTDGGATWSATAEKGPVFALAVDPANPAVLYAAGGAFVAASADGGATWSPLKEGFPPYADATTLALDAKHHTLYAGTQGRGVWALALP